MSNNDDLIAVVRGVPVCMERVSPELRRRYFLATKAFAKLEKTSKEFEQVCDEILREQAPLLGFKAARELGRRAGHAAIDALRRRALTE